MFGGGAATNIECLLSKSACYLQIQSPSNSETDQQWFSTLARQKLKKFLRNFSFSQEIQDNPLEPVLSQGRDLLEQEQPLDFYEPNVLPATQTIVSKHYRRKTQWFGLFCFTDTISAPHV